MRGLQIRGTNGSGKTTIVRNLLKRGVFRLECNEKGKVEKYIGGVSYESPKSIAWLPLTILGSYEATCGGCDTIPSVGRVAELLKSSFVGDNQVVVYEGLMISHMLGTVGAAQRELGINTQVLAFLDTPLDTCIQRVVKRRADRGDFRPFDPKNVVKDYAAVQLSRKKALREGYRVVDVPHLEAVSFIDSLIVELYNES